MNAKEWGGEDGISNADVEIIKLMHDLSPSRSPFFVSYFFYFSHTP